MIGRKKAPGIRYNYYRAFSFNNNEMCVSALCKCLAQKNFTMVKIHFSGQRIRMEHRKSKSF